MGQLSDCSQPTSSLLRAVPPKGGLCSGPLPAAGTDPHSTPSAPAIRSTLRRRRFSLVAEYRAILHFLSDSRISSSRACRTPQELRSRRLLPGRPRLQPSPASTVMEYSPLSRQALPFYARPPQPEQQGPGLYRQSSVCRAPPHSTRATLNSVIPLTRTRATTTSCGIRSSRRHSTTRGARQTG